jgi:uncharacterized protein YegP (UPF0339 family)
MTEKVSFQKLWNTFRVKTDKADSYFIAEYGRTFFDRELYKPKSDVEKEIEVKLKTLDSSLQC